MLALKNINYKACIIGILTMLALNNINYKASIIGILTMLALNNINYKDSIIFMEYLYYDSINLEKVSCENAGALNKECSFRKNFIPFCSQINHFIHKIIAMIKFKYSEML